MAQVKILLADDHELVRSGIRSLFVNIADFEVVGEISNGNDVLPFLEAQEPDLVLMDISMPGRNGIDITERIVQLYPDIHILILSMHAIEEYVIRALSAGAHGYVLKSASSDELYSAIRVVMAGERYLDQAMSKPIIDKYLQSVRKEPENAGGKQSPRSLTNRQREVLQQIADGKSTLEVARNLHISMKTVGSHRHNIMKRLGIYNIAELTRYAISIGLVEPIQLD